MLKEINISDLSQTKAISEKVASILQKTNVLCLEGDLGSGKTAFTTLLINHIDPKIKVTSPTFNLLNIYETEKFPIYHYDLYRLKNKNELHELGFEDAFSNGLTIIEWPEVAKDLLGNNTINIKFEFDGSNNRKLLIDLAKNPRFTNIL